MVNDLASYEKENQDYQRGTSKSLINVVSVVQQLLSLESEAAAKIATYGLQLQLELDIEKELKELWATNGPGLDVEEWRFVDGVLLMLAGNVFTSGTIERYGPKSSRLDHPKILQANNF